MPSNWGSLDNGFPTFTGREDPEQQIRALHDYLYQLREALRYSLQNLTAENFNAAALKDLTDEQKNALTEELTKVTAALNQMGTQVERLASRVSGVESLAGRVTDAETEITYLQARMDTAETRVAGLEQDVEDTGQSVQALEGGMTDAQTEIDGLDGRIRVLEEDQSLDTLRRLVTGTGGLQEQVALIQERLDKIAGLVQVADDGSATVGQEGQILNLVGQIYINGVLYEGGSSETT